MIACPSRDDLTAFAAGKLPKPALETVADHLSTCANCSGALDTLDDAPDPLLRQLRELPPADAVESSEATRVIALVEALTGPPRDGAGDKLTLPASARPLLQKLGQYQLLGRLGEGGMGQVYKARHALMNRVVAVKVIHHKRLNQPDAVARFHREVRALAQLDHPNIVRAEYADQEGDLHYLVMDYVDGANLARLVRLQGPLAVDQACACIQQAARGLQHAHERGLVHRDLKPSNLMLSSTGVVKMLDLGLVQWQLDPAEDDVTEAGQLLGTASYMAPEQADSAHHADIRADIYSLGCTLYFLLAGRGPFDGPEFDSVLKKVKAHALSPPPAIKRLRPDVPDKLVAVLERMLAKKPADRFPNPAAVVEALEPFVGQANLRELSTITLAGEAVNQVSTITERPSTREAPAKRRRRLWIGGAIAASVLVLAGAVVTIAWLERPGGHTPRGPGEGKPLQGTPKDIAQKKDNLSLEPVRITSFQIKHYRGDPPTPFGTLGVLSERVQAEDDVKILAKFSAPAHCYLIAFNADGVEQFLLPEDAAATPPLLEELVFPSRYWTLDNRPGLQAFVLLASREPLPSYNDWKAGHGSPPWKADQAADRMWRLEAQKLVPAIAERGKERKRPEPPQALQGLVQFFQSHAGNAALEVFAFPVRAKE